MATAWTWRMLTRGDGDGAPPELAPYPGHGSIFPLETRPLLDALADAIVPRWGGHPAASEIGIASRLERWLLTSPLRSRVYRTYWPGFGMTHLSGGALGWKRLHSQAFHLRRQKLWGIRVHMYPLGS